VRALGLTPHPHLEHVITTSARTAGPQDVGIAVVDDPGTLLLVSDGVHRAVSASAMAAALAAGGGAGERAARIVRLAETAGLTDNATALVVAG
jgi:protein phosphatase